MQPEGWKMHLQAKNLVIRHIVENVTYGNRCTFEKRIEYTPSTKHEDEQNWIENLEVLGLPQI
jgi:hypothetical protein